MVLLIWLFLRISDHEHLFLCFSALCKSFCFFKVSFFKKYVCWVFFKILFIHFFIYGCVGEESTGMKPLNIKHDLDNINVNVIFLNNSLSLCPNSGHAPSPYLGLGLNVLSPFPTWKGRGDKRNGRNTFIRVPVMSQRKQAGFVKGLGAWRHQTMISQTS